MSVSHTDDAGNPRVDFVWGNVPMQPNDQRLDSVVTPANVENVGWTQGSLYYSDNLQIGSTQVTRNNLEVTIPLDSHEIADLGYSNYPAYIPNYSGDEDSGFETVVPNLLRKTRAEAEVIVDNANLNLFDISHNPTVESIVSTGKVVRVYAYDYDAYGDSALVGIKVGDEIWVDNNLHDFGSDPLTVTNTNDDGDASWIEFETATAIDPALDDTAAGTIWAGPNLVNVITVQRFWNQPGDIRNEWTNIHVRYVGA